MPFIQRQMFAALIGLFGPEPAALPAEVDPDHWIKTRRRNIGYLQQHCHKQCPVWCVTFCNSLKNMLCIPNTSFSLTAGNQKWDLRLEFCAYVPGSKPQSTQQNLRKKYTVLHILYCHGNTVTIQYQGWKHFGLYSFFIFQDLLGQQLKGKATAGYMLSPFQTEENNRGGGGVCKKNALFPRSAQNLGILIYKLQQ